MSSEGAILITPGDGRSEIETATITCCHCNCIYIVRPGSGKQRGFCLLCYAPTCGKPKCQDCYPFMKKVEEQENRHRLHKAMERGYDA